MKVRLAIPPQKDQLCRYQTCYLDTESDIEFRQKYGWDTEFIAELIPDDEANDPECYIITMDQIVREGSYGTIRSLDDNRLIDAIQMKSALIHDYKIPIEAIDILTGVWAA